VGRSRASKRCARLGASHDFLHRLVGSVRAVRSANSAVLGTPKRAERRTIATKIKTEPIHVQVRSVTPADLDLEPLSMIVSSF